MDKNKRRFISVLAVGFVATLAVLGIPGLTKTKNEEMSDIKKMPDAKSKGMAEGKNKGMADGKNKVKVSADASSATIGNTRKELESELTGKKILSNEEWRKILTKSEYKVLRKAGTEPPFSSPLNDEKRMGVYYCKGCDSPLFISAWKFDSGTGWPSFYTSVKGAFVTSTDYILLYPRTEYHCATCEGHHGHVFKDGPAPTNERWCNNGVALTFRPKNIDELQFESEAGNV